MDSMKNLGIVLDESLNFVKHSKLVVREYDYHIRNIGAVGR